MPMDTNYPGLKQTFAEQTNDTIPGASYPNTQSATLEALEDRVGYTSSVAGDPNHEGRILALESASPSRVTYANTQPSDLALQVWIDTTDPLNWIYRIQEPDLSWTVIGANAVSLVGIPIATGTPGDGYVPYYNAATNSIGWSAAAGGFNNPLQANQDILIGTTPIVGSRATPGRLPVGTANQMLITNATGILTWVNQPTPGIPTTVLAHTNGLIIGGALVPGSSPQVATPVELQPGTINQVLGMVTGSQLGYITPYWIPAPGDAIQGSMLYFDSDARWHQLPPPASSGQFLRGNAGGNPVWSDLPAGGVTGGSIIAPGSPTTGDILVYIAPNWSVIAHDASTAGRYLMSNGANAVPTWTTPPQGLTNPMHVTGALLYSTNNGGVPGQIDPTGHADGEVLTLAGGIPAWVARPNPFVSVTAAGQLIVGSGAGTVTVVNKGTAGQVFRMLDANTLGWGADTDTTYSVFTNAASGLVPPSGANNDASHVLAGNGAWVILPTGSSVFNASTNGLVPAPGSSNDAVHFLAGDGVWRTIAGGGGGGTTFYIKDHGGAPAVIDTLNITGAGVTVGVVGTTGTVDIPGGGGGSGGGSGGASGAVYDAPPSVAGGHWTVFNNTGPVVAITDVASGIAFSMPVGQSGIHVRGLMEAVPVSTPWRVVAKWDAMMRWQNSMMAGMFLRDAATGRLYTYSVYVDTGSSLSLGVHMMADADGTNAVNSDVTVPGTGNTYERMVILEVPWLSITFDGTTYTFDYSYDDGQTWLTFATRAATGAYVANVTHVGAHVNNWASSIAFKATLRSWGYASPGMVQGSTASVLVQDEGGTPAPATQLNVVGAGASVSVTGGVATLNVSGGGAGGGGASLYDIFANMGG